jgi:hypothetical protein
LNVTIARGLRERMAVLVDRMPGANLSQLAEELIAASLPLYEGMAESIISARREDGTVDERVAHQLVAARIGKIIGLNLDVTHDDDGGESST